VAKVYNRKAITARGGEGAAILKLALKMLPEWVRQRGEGIFCRRLSGLASAGVGAVLSMCRTQRWPERCMAFVVQLAVGLFSVFNAELANHDVEVAGQRGQVLQAFYRLLGALGGLGGQLRDLSGGLGDLSRGRCLLGG
jgi:hypothetical protein